MKAVSNGTVLAESEKTLVVEGNHYFPPDSVDQRYLSPTRMRSLCFWKGLASYYTIKVGNQRNRNAAWTYHRPCRGSGRSATTWPSGTVSRFDPRDN